MVHKRKKVYKNKINIRKEPHYDLNEMFILCIGIGMIIPLIISMFVLLIILLLKYN